MNLDEFDGGTSFIVVAPTYTDWKAQGFSYRIMKANCCPKPTNGFRWIDGYLHGMYLVLIMSAVLLQTVGWGLRRQSTLIMRLVWLATFYHRVWHTILTDETDMIRCTQFVAVYR